MRRLLTLLGVLCTILCATYVALASISIPTGSAYSQNFDGMGIPATTTTASTLPTDFKADNPSTVRTVGSFAAAGTTTPRAGGASLSTSAANGIYSFGAGTTTLGNADRAIGFLSSGTATASGNLYAQLVNASGAGLSGLQISYNVEKYRGGSNPAGFRIQMFYSTDGTSWTNAGANFLSSFGADANNNGFATVPGATLSVSNQTLNVAIPNGASFYLAWNYSVSSGSTTTNGQALAVDDISIKGVPLGPTNPTGTGSASPSTVQAGTSTLLTVAATPGANPNSTGLAVTADLTSIGGSATQAFAANGNTFTFSALVPATTTAGPKTIPATITDSQGRTGAATISLTVTPASTVPTGTGSATPISLRAGETTLLTVTVTPGSNPTSTGIGVAGDLSAIGGSASQPFNDNGGNAFSFSAAIANGTTPGPKSLLITISDAQGRSGSTTIALTVQPPPPPTTVKISQVYAGGGNSGSTYTNDFIEIFNEDVNPIDLTGWSVQYNSAGATTGSWQMTSICPAGPCVVAPGHYFLVEESLGTGGTTALPLPNAVGTINMGASSGKVALMNIAVPISGQCPAVGTFVDLVGYGSANCSEANATAPGLSNTTASIRRGNGCQDTDNNSADFIATGPIPRNSLAPVNTCGGDPTQPSGLGIATPDSVDPASNTLLTVRVTPAIAPLSTGVTVVANLSVIGGASSQPFYDDGTHGDLLAGDNIFSFQQIVSAAATTGAKYMVGVIGDAQGRTATAPITLTVQSPTCGVERWVVKVGSDACSPSSPQPCFDVGDVRLDIPPTSAAILDLGSIAPPAGSDIDTGGAFATTRDAPVETTVYVVDATLTFYKKESDVDYHIVLSDNAVPTPHTLIAEIPNPACILAPNPSGPGRILVPSPLGSGIASARAAFDARLSAQTFFQNASIPVRVTGVGFFDFEHGQTGVAPNAIELHPVLRISFRANTTTTLLSAGTPIYGQPLSFTATVTTGGENTPTGDLTFFYNGNSVVVPLDSNGQASFTTATIASGSYSMIASYAGDDTSVASSSAPLPFTVAKADQSIDFGALAGKTYGDPDFTVGGGASSGLPVTFSIASGPAIIAGTTVHITGAGAVVVRASQAGADNYNAAADVDRSFDVAPAALSVIANSATREFGAGNPPLTGTLAGVVAGDGITASFSTAAGPASPVGSYPIAPALNDPNGRLGNYIVTAQNGVLTVVDTTPPAIDAVTPSVTSIWPPNKSRTAVSIAVAVVDAADPAPVCRVTGVSSNEPEAGDSAITGPLTVSLLANRNGDGNGRIYTIGVRCVDASGNATTSSTTVTVPHDQGK